MDLQQLQESTEADQPPAELPLALAALWWDFKGDWAKAHECAQQRETPEHAWVHAYLHRKEGDLDNARYWYRRSGRAPFNGSLEEEWANIAIALLRS